MKKYLFLFLLIIVLVALYKTNPTQQEYGSWMTEQFMKTEVDSRIANLKEKSAGTFLEGFVDLGEDLSNKYLQPNVEKLVGNETMQKDYLFFSIFTTDIDLLEENIHFRFIGMMNYFIPLEVPEEWNNQEK